MHPLLENISFLTWTTIVGCEETAVAFATEIGLLPSDNAGNLECPRCRAKLNRIASKNCKLGWRWRCSLRWKKCSGIINPINGTFFENTRINIQDILTIVFGFVTKFPVNVLYEAMQNWRRYREDKVLSKATVVDYYFFCREICEIISSHDSSLLGGVGKTIDINETFLTTRKYNKRCVIDEIKITVLGIYCREDKEGLFFQIHDKSKQQIQYYIKKHCHPDTSVVCTDSSLQYSEISSFFNNVTHKDKRLSKGKLASEKDESGSTNDFENKSNHFKKFLKNKKPKFLQQYMAVYFYFNHYMAPLKTQGERIEWFLKDIAKVYPGPGKKPLTLLTLDHPAIESDSIEQDLELLVKKPKIEETCHSECPNDEIMFVDDMQDSDWEEY